MALTDLSTIKQRAIIIAAGDGTRWGKYLGIDKHFIEIDGEKLIHRTVRQLRDNGIEDIWVVGKDKRYEIPGAKFFLPELNEHNDGVDKFLNSKELWIDGRTIVLYGDVYFSEYAMGKIVNHNHRDWQLFARAFGSRITGCKWGECFAQSFYTEHIPEHKRNLEKAVKLWHQGKIRRPSGWQHYRFMIGLPPNRVDEPFVGDRFVNIDDFTDDFDSPDDYDRWMQNYKEWKSGERLLSLT